MSSVKTEGSPHMGQSTAPTTPVELEDNAGDIMRQAMADIALTWSYLNEGFAMLQEQTEQFNDLPVEPRIAPEEIQDVINQIDIHGWKMDTEFSEIKAKIDIDVHSEVAKSITAKSKDWAALIREETIKQVKEQVDAQISEHLPESLEQQVKETKRQVAGVKVSLQNSQARMANSFIHTGSLDSPLSPILTPRGMKSPYYPPNTRSLLKYDLESAKALSRHYELTESDDLSVNFQQFLKHIGTGVEVMVSPK